MLPEGELVDFIEEFSDGRIQFGFVKVKDPNTTLPKCVLVGWVRRKHHCYIPEKLIASSAVKVFLREPRDTLLVT
jgi:hypothetical protein